MTAMIHFNHLLLTKMKQNTLRNNSIQISYLI